MVKTDAAEASDSEPTNGTVATAAAVKEVVTGDFDITREEKCESCDCYNVNEHWYVLHSSLTNHLNN